MAQPKKRPFVSLKGMETGRVTSAGKPVYKYKGEEISEKSIDIEADGKTYVIPTVIDGKLYTEDAAVAKFFNKEVEPIKVLKENIKERSKNLAEGGTVMKKQMEMFEDGGLKDEGGMTDEVSGNDVPSGSTREEVRDDIPAQLSEGEFVFPADVVRYIGLAKLMQLRQEAKQGLKQMEAMGQMGNSDEATMADDLPFDETDLDIEDDLEYNTGGVVQAQRGTYLAPTIPIGRQPLGTNPMGNPTQIMPQQVASGVSGASRGTPYVPNVGNVYGAGATPYAPVSYQDFLGPSAGGAPKTESVRYFNEATGQTRMIPHIVNADGSRGATLYPIPEGFVIQEEAPKEEAKKSQVASAKVKPVDAGNDSRDQEEREREEAMYGRGAGRISLGGEIKPGTTVKTGFLGKGTSSLTKNSTTFGIGYDFPGGILPGIAAIKAITAGTGNLPDGATGKFTLDGITITKSAKVTNAIIKNPRGPEATAIIEQNKNMRAAVAELIQDYNITNNDARDIVEGLAKDNPNINQKDKMVDVIDKNIREGNITTEQFVDLGDIPFNEYQSAAIDKEDRERADVEQKAAEKATGMTYAQLVEQTGGDDNNNSFDDSDYGGFDSSDPGDMDGSNFDFNAGGLAGKKKPKPKKMKRGGLASR